MVGVETDINANSAPNWVGIGAGAELGNKLSRQSCLDPILLLVRVGGGGWVC